MKKKIISLFTVILLLLNSAAPAFATSSIERFYYKLRYVIPWDVVFNNLKIAAIVGAIIAIFFLLSERRKMKTIEIAKNAEGYVAQGETKISIRRDIYMGTTVTRIPKADSNHGGGPGHGGPGHGPHH